MSDKKKVYVETTVVSDATALPTNNLRLQGDRWLRGSGGRRLLTVLNFIPLRL